MNSTNQELQDIFGQEQVDLMEYMYEVNNFHDFNAQTQSFAIDMSNNGQYIVFRSQNEIILYSLKNKIVLFRVSIMQIIKQYFHKGLNISNAKQELSSSLFKTVIPNSCSVLIIALYNYIIILNVKHYIKHQRFQDGFPEAQTLMSKGNQEGFKMIIANDNYIVQDIHIIKETQTSIKCLLNMDNNLHLYEIQIQYVKGQLNSNVDLQAITLQNHNVVIDVQNTIITYNNNFVAMLNTNTYVLSIYQLENNVFRLLHTQNYITHINFNQIKEIVANYQQINLFVNSQCDIEDKKNIVLFQLVIRAHCNIILLETYYVLGAGQSDLNLQISQQHTNINLNQTKESDIYTNENMYIFDLQMLNQCVPTTMMIRYRNSPSLNKQLDDIQNISGGVLYVGMYYRDIMLVVTQSMIVHLFFNKYRQLMYQSVDKFLKWQDQTKYTAKALVHIISNKVTMIISFHPFQQMKHNSQQELKNTLYDYINGHYFYYKNNREQQSVDHYFLGLKGLQKNEKYIEREDDFDIDPDPQVPGDRLVDIAYNNCKILNGIISETTIDAFRQDMENFNHFAYIQQLSETNKKHQADTAGINNQEDQIKYYESLTEPQINI